MSGFGWAYISESDVNVWSSLPGKKRLTWAITSIDKSKRRHDAEQKDSKNEHFDQSMTVNTEIRQETERKEKANCWVLIKRKKKFK